MRGRVFPTQMSHLLPPLTGRHRSRLPYISHTSKTLWADVLPATLHGCLALHLPTTVHRPTALLWSIVSLRMAVHWNPQARQLQGVSRGKIQTTTRYFEAMLDKMFVLFSSFLLFLWSLFSRLVTNSPSVLLNQWAYLSIFYLLLLLFCLFYANEI